MESGFNGLLDIARRTYKEMVQDALSLSDEYAGVQAPCDSRISALMPIELFELPLQIRFESSSSFYMTLKVLDMVDTVLPTEFINITKKNGLLRFTTLRLIKINYRIDEALTEVISSFYPLRDSLSKVLLISEECLEGLIRMLQPEMDALYRAAEAVAMLDMVRSPANVFAILTDQLSSFATVSVNKGFVRPLYTEVLAIKKGRHPVKDSMESSIQVPNDTFSSCDARLQILSGCNMAGKTTYMKQIALITIIAQIGCYVPAEYASIPLKRQILTKLSDDGGSSLTSSSFTREMQEMSFILKEINRDSLVLVDELGRGTSVEDALAITTAICEVLLESQATVLFCTHFTDLQRLFAYKAGAINKHLEVRHDRLKNSLTMLYRVSNGINIEEGYGIRLAKSLSFPTLILDRAERLQCTLAQGLVDQRQASKFGRLMSRRKGMLAICDALKTIHERDAKGNNCTRLEAAALRELLADFLSSFENTLRQTE